MPWHGLGILDIMNKTEFTVCSALWLSLFNCVQLCDPIDGSPPRLPRPWDSPGKNTGVGCHFLLQCMKVKSKSEVAQSCLTLCDPMDCSLPGSSALDICFPSQDRGELVHGLSACVGMGLLPASGGPRLLGWRAHRQWGPRLIRTCSLGLCPPPRQCTPVWDWASVGELLTLLGQLI